MTLPQIREVLAQAERIGSVEWIFFEGGEPFLFYPTLLEGIRLAKAMGFAVGVVTNAYGAISEADADAWLRPLAELGVDELSVSDDGFHFGEADPSPARLALAAAQKLGLPTSAISIEKPVVEVSAGRGKDRGRPVIGGGVKFRGRAVEKLTDGLPRRPWSELTQCPDEDLTSPSRVQVDAYGHVQLCQGLSMGNLWQRPLSQLVSAYDPLAHPVCGPLISGGPALLAERYAAPHEDGYVDECHFCWCLRRGMVDRLGRVLAPRQVYGWV